MTDEQKTKVREIFESFLQRRAQKIKKLRFQNLEINPFLIRLMSKELDLIDARSIVEWRVQQHWERGLVTAFGFALQEIAKIFSEGTGVEGADVLKIKNGRHHHIQVKSGPNTIPKDMAQRLTQLLHSAQRRNRGSVAMFGMCYGTPVQISNIIGQYIEVDTIVGRAFWEFISDDPNCIDEIYEIAAEVSGNYEVEPGKTLKQLLADKIADLQAEFEILYDVSGDKMWNQILHRNS